MLHFFLFAQPTNLDFLRGNVLWCWSEKTKGLEEEEEEGEAEEGWG